MFARVNIKSDSAQPLAPNTYSPVSGSGEENRRDPRDSLHALTHGLTF